jgi:hypothetical protein
MSSELELISCRLTMGVTNGAGTDNHSGAPVFTTGFRRVHCARSLVFCVVFCRTLFVRLPFYCLPLCCFLITPMVALNFLFNINNVSKNTVLSSNISAS